MPSSTRNPSYASVDFADNADNTVGARQVANVPTTRKRPMDA
jgi:hypothetical protein